MTRDPDASPATDPRQTSLPEVPCVPASATPNAPGAPDVPDAGESAGHATRGQPAGTQGDSSAIGLTRHAADAMAHHANPHGSRARRARIPPKARTAAELIACGTPIAQVCEQLGVVASTVWRWRHEPWWAAEHRRAQASVVTAAESELASARLAAVRRLRQILDAPDGVDPGEQSAAARAVLAASAPPGELSRQRARRELLSQLTPSTRALVAAELDEPELAAIESMSIDELRRDLGVPIPPKASDT